MPSGVYTRTDKHLAQCSRAGKISCAKKRALWSCINCGKEKIMPLKTKRKYCSVNCHNEHQTDKAPKTYGTLHAWVRRNFGTPSICEHCGDTTSKKFEWANISGKYTMSRKDWARLCCQCHRRYDRGVKKRIEVLNV